MTQISGASSSSAEKPLFRYDLQTSAIQESGNRYVDVTGPDGGQSFRFYEVEYAVACGMDGQRDVAGIVQWAQQELDLETNSNEVGAIVAKLIELNYIEGVSAAAPIAAAPIAAAPIAAAPIAAAPIAAAPVAAAPVAATGSGFELGDSGKSAINSPRPSAPASADNIELGVAGITDRPEREAPAPRPVIESEFELGNAGNEDVVPVQTPAPEVVAPDIAPAVAASDPGEAAVSADGGDQVISAGDVSADIASAVMEAEEATPEAVAESADISDSIAQEAIAAKTPGEEAISLADSAENDAKRAAAKAKEEALAAKRAARKPIVRKSATFALLLILLGAVAGAAYYYFFHTPYVLEHPADQPLVTHTPKHTKAPIPAPVPLAADSTMTATEIPVEDALTIRAGIVEWVLDPGSEVTADDAILKIIGSKRFQAVVTRETTALHAAQDRLTAAEEAETPDKLDGIAAEIAAKEASLAAAVAKLAPFMVTAPIDGVVEVLVKAKDRVTAEQAVAKVTGTAKAMAVFTLSEGNSAEVADEFVVMVIADNELKTTCTVVEVVEQEITLECPSDSGIEADTAVKLQDL